MISFYPFYSTSIPIQSIPVGSKLPKAQNTLSWTPLQGDRCDHLTWKWQKWDQDHKWLLKAIQLRMTMNLLSSWANTTWYRNFATSASTPAGLLLVGGFSAPWTSELISREGGSTEAFVPTPGRSYHCSIQVWKTRGLVACSYHQPYATTFKPGRSSPFDNSGCLDNLLFLYFFQSHTATGLMVFWG